MPADFDRCVENGGKVRTVSGPNKEHGLKKGEYVRYCTIDGKSYRGEVKQKSKSNMSNVITSPVEGSVSAKPEMKHYAVKIQVDAKNSENKPAIRHLRGVEHIVVPAIILVQGVIHSANAEHPALALAEEFALFPEGWDGRPIVYNHPKDGDQAASANSPDRWDSEVIGQLFGSTLKSNTKLFTNLWIDKTKAPKVVLDGFEAGEPFEVSTGLYTLEEQTSGTYEGRDYEVIWRNVVPDHLAVLSPGTIGACSIEDGCGAPRTNQSNVSEVSEKFRNNLYFAGEPQIPNQRKDAPMAEKTDSAPQVNAGACGCPTSPTAAIVSATPNGKDTDAPAPKTVTNEEPGTFRKILDGFLGILGIKQNEVSDVDRRTALELALQGAGERPSYVVAAYSDTVVYMEMNQDYSWHMYTRSYSIADGGAITLGSEATEVRPETQYVPLVVTTQNADDPAPTDNQATGEPMSKQEDPKGAAPAAPEVTQTPAQAAAPTPAAAVEEPVVNTEPKKATTMEDLMELADEGLKAHLEKIIKSNADRREALIKALDGKVGLSVDDLKKLDFEVLEKMATSIAPEAVNFAPAAGGPAPANNQSAEDKSFTPPTLVFPKKAA